MGTSGLDPTGPNAKQAEFWDGPGGDRWTENQEIHDRIWSPLSDRGLDALGLSPGDRVLDIGCGCGGTTLEIARRVGTLGSVLGVDLSTRMIARARERAAAAPALNADFVQADAQTYGFAQQTFDAAFSRLGVMFFVDPAAAFSNVRKALRPGGRITFLCWRDVRENAWAMITVDPARDLIDMPPRPGPEDPGPFSFREPDRVRRILGDAGLNDVSLTPLDLDLSFGATLDEAVINIQHTGPVANAVSNAPEDVRAIYAKRVRDALSPYVHDQGVMVGSASWIATATAP